KAQRYRYETLGRSLHVMLNEKQPRLGGVMAFPIVQKGGSLVPRPPGRGLLAGFDGGGSFRLGQSVGGSLNSIPTSSRPRTIAEFYRCETKDFGRVRSHRLWASGQNGFTIGLGDLKRRFYWDFCGYMSSFPQKNKIAVLKFSNFL